MAGSSEVVVKFLADTSAIRGAADDVKTHTNRIAGFAKVAGAAVAGMFVVHEVADFVGAAEEAESVSKKLAKSLENAGDASGEWHKNAEKLADQMMRQTGIDDEVIKSGQTILATFHAVGGELGQTSGIFDRATRATADLAKAGFGDVDTAAKQLGKALEDPIKGVGALAKAGVTFNDVQKKQIKGFVEAGDKASAMGLIMDVVEGQVGGVAEASVTASDKMSVAWGETQEALGALLLPALEALTPALQSAADWIQLSLIPALSTMFDWIGNNIVPALSDFASAVGDKIGPAVQAVVDWVQDELIPAFGDIADWISEHRDDIAGYFTPYIDAAKKVIPWIAGIVVTFAFLTKTLVEKLAPAMKTAVDWIDKHREIIPIYVGLILVTLVPALYAWAAAAGAAAVAMIAAMLPIIAAIAVIALVGGAIYLVGQLLGGWVDSWYMAGNIVTTAGGKIWTAVQFVWQAMQTAYHWIADNWPLLGTILVGPFAWVVSWVNDRFDILDKLTGVWDWITNTWWLIGDALINPFQRAAAVIRTILGGILAAVDAVVSAVERIKNVLGSIKSGSPGMGVPFELPGVPGHAAGGIFTKPHLALIAENGPEAVVPLKQSGSMPGLGTVNIYVTTTGLGASSAQIQSSVATALRNYTARNGPV